MSILDELADLLGAPEVALLAPSSPVVVAEPPAPTVAEPIVLAGRLLRYRLSLELRRQGESTVAALIDRLQRSGYCLIGRPSKAVSDALRWEIGHGRVVRVARGHYRTGRIPRSTIWWMTRTLEDAEERWHAASPEDRKRWSQPAPRRPVAQPGSASAIHTARRRRQRERERRRRGLGSLWHGIGSASPPLTT